MPYPGSPLAAAKTADPSYHAIDPRVNRRVRSVMLKWTARVAGIVVGGLCIFAGLTVGRSEGGGQTPVVNTAPLPVLITTPTTKPCFGADGYQVWTGPEERKILGCD